jgi:hypothetical protein
MAGVGRKPDAVGREVPSLTSPAAQYRRNTCTDHAASAARRRFSELAEGTEIRPLPAGHRRRIAAW